jgi:protein TonB
MKVERVGEVNYPQAAREQKIYGSLVLTVNIKSDGSVERIEISRPSGHKFLDDAARRIVTLARHTRNFRRISRRTPTSSASRAP